MLRDRTLSDDTRATAQSALVWSVMAILLITLAVPGALWAAQGIQDLSKDESYFNPNKVEDFNKNDGYMAILKNPGTMSTYYTSSNYICYAYDNTTEDIKRFNEGLYTKNFTGKDTHEFLAQQSSSDAESFESFTALTIGLNRSTNELIEEDLNKVKFTADFPRNSTDVTLKLMVGWSDDAEENRGFYELASKQISATTDMKEYSMDVDYSKILDADSKAISDNSQLSLVIDGTTNSTVEELQPGDSLKFNIDLMHSTSSVSSFWTMNIVAGVSGVFVMIGAVFATPFVDLKDLTGGYWG